MKKKDFTYRQLAIEKTLRIESITSFLIKNIIGLALNQETKTLSNKSSSLSLKSKIDLLYDCQKLTKKDYSNLLHILSIRNQFAHNFDCNKFEDLPIYIDGIEKPLLKFCEERTSDLNQDLVNGYNKMIETIMETLKIHFNEIISDAKRQLKNAKARHNRVIEKRLKYYGIIERTEIKKFKPIFIKIFKEEKEKGHDMESLAINVDKRILKLLKENGR
ncbi:hypothetical protein [Winogradskyella sp.]|uniref:hypothetical protein n=1 Tax=Winogradskyella sp. TaxID=1883156 RepID=UPI0025D1122C|nr:hypothetical protein [Winogradskyella sp.]